MNSYEEAARARKVITMVSSIDRAAIAKNIDPHGNAGQVLLALIGYSSVQCAIVDRVSKLKTCSSEETRKAVKKVYSDRATSDILDIQ